MFNKIFQYGITAGIAAVVDIFGYAGLIYLKVPFVMAAVSSWVLSAVVNYLLTSFYVFQHQISIKHGCKFFAGALCGLVVNVLVTVYVNKNFIYDPFFAKIIGIGSAFIINFLVASKIVFRPQK